MCGCLSQAKKKQSGDSLWDLVNFQALEKEKKEQLDKEKQERLEKERQEQLEKEKKEQEEREHEEQLAGKRARDDEELEYNQRYYLRNKFMKIKDCAFFALLCVLISYVLDNMGW